MATGINPAERTSTWQPETSVDARSRLVVNGWLGDDRLIAIAVPTDWCDRSLGTAGEALSALATSLARSEYIADLSGAERITRAITAANESVLTANRARCGNETEKHCGVGVAVALRSGKAVTIAMVPPVQVILFQGSGQTWLPRRESWISDDTGLDGQPLGWSESIRPTVVSAYVRDRDEVFLASGAVGLMMAKTDGTCTDPAAACQTIGDACTAGLFDPFEVVAVSTRFAPQSLAGSMRSATGHLFGSVDRRARSVLSHRKTSD